MVFRFGSFELDVAERRLTDGNKPITLRPKVFDTLCVLVENQGRLLRKDQLIKMIWPDSVVEDNNLDHNISKLRQALGDKQNTLIETVPRQGYRFIAEVTRPDVVSSTASAATPASESEDAPIEQQIQFFTADDGAQIAYSVTGTGPVLVKAANWLNHLEFELKSPVWRHWLPLLMKNNTVVRYDERGNGLSSWNIQDFSFQAWCRDLTLLMDTLSLKKFSLLGISQGASVAVWCAANYPERVERLILYGGYSRGWAYRNDPEELEVRNALLTLIRTGWGRNNPSVRQMFTTRFIPDATPEQMNWFNELQRVTTSPENAVQFMATFSKLDVVDLLPRVQCPTIVIHASKDAVVPVREGRLLASRIRGARFVELPSQNHIVLKHEPAWDIFVKELSSFMGWEAKESAKTGQV